MPINPSNTKTFRLTNRISKTFQVVIAGFEFATSLFFHIRFTIHQVFNSSVKMKAVTNINLRKVILSAIAILKSKNLLTINLRQVKLAFTPKEVGKLTINFVEKLPIAFSLKAILKNLLTVNLKKIVLTITMILAHYWRLLDFDPQQLSALDVQTLGQMDYQIL